MKLGRKTYTDEEIRDMPTRKHKQIQNWYKSSVKYLATHGHIDEFYKTHTRHLCTKCKSHVGYKMAVAQIENKRDEAPICMKCILS